MNIEDFKLVWEVAKNLQETAVNSEAKARSFNNKLSGLLTEHFSANTVASIGTCPGYENGKAFLWVTIEATTIGRNLLHELSTLLGLLEGEVSNVYKMPAANGEKYNIALKIRGIRSTEGHV